MSTQPSPLPFLFMKKQGLPASKAARRRLDNVQTKLPFHLVDQACKKTGSSVILIGGQALSAWGYQRMTLDVDFMITEPDYMKIKPEMCASGFQEMVRTSVA